MMRHGRGCDCDDCFAAREHAKHSHCLDCRACLGAENVSTEDGDRCVACAPAACDCNTLTEVHHGDCASNGAPAAVADA